MTPQDIINDINDKYLEHLEMIDDEIEKFVLVRNILALKLSQEISEKDFYKNLYHKSLKSTHRINS